MTEPAMTAHQEAGTATNATQPHETQSAIQAFDSPEDAQSVADCVAPITDALIPTEPLDSTLSAEWAAHIDKLYKHARSLERDLTAAREALATLQNEREQRRKEYAEHNPMGGTARMFECMAERLRAGEPFVEVLEDYCLCRREALEAKERECAEWKDEAERMRQAALREREVERAYQSEKLQAAERRAATAEAALAAANDGAAVVEGHLRAELAEANRLMRAAADAHACAEKSLAGAEAALAGVREESKWVRRKLGLLEDCGFTSGETTLAGTMHNVCHNSHCYLAYVYTYKCNDKQGIIANLTRALLPFAEPPETNQHSGPADDYDRARDILAKIPTAPPSSGSPAEGA